MSQITVVKENDGKVRGFIGLTFGRLVVIGRGARARHWLCRCRCGTEKEVFASSLVRGMTTSCGCYRAEVLRTMERWSKHRLSGHRLYNLFMQIKYRCTNPNSESYPDYGGRGIKCLFRGPVHFIRWALASGYEPGLSIDRRNNDGPYTPSNCRWVRMKEQQRNRSNNKALVIHGVSRCVAEWAEAAGLSTATLKSRLRRGWPATQAVLTPADKAFARVRRSA